MTLRSRAVDTVFNVLEFFAATYDFARGLRRRNFWVGDTNRLTVPDPDRIRDTDPIPLTHKDSERIAEFGRRAGHETGPIPKAPRVPKI